MCECKCRLNESLFNSCQKWNHDTFQCECKESVDWSSCKKGYVWNPSTYDFECDKKCKISQYLDIKNSAYKNCVIDDLVLTSEDEIVNATNLVLIVDRKRS